MEKIKLTEAEWKIMTMLWDRGPMTIMQLTAALKEETGWSKNTVIVLLGRMEKKNAVTYERCGNAKQYRSLMMREDVGVSETKSFLKRVYKGSLGMMMNLLIEQKAVSKEDIAELYNILKKAEEEEK